MLLNYAENQNEPFTHIKTNKPCQSCRQLIVWLFYGIPQVNPWKDWKIRNKDLISPSGEIFTPKHLEILPILRQWRRLQQAEDNKIKRNADRKIKKMAYYT